MAGTGHTTYARAGSSYLDHALERERSAVDICRWKYTTLLTALWRELSKEHRDEKVVAELLNDAVYAEAVLSVARAELEEAEECA